MPASLSARARQAARAATLRRLVPSHLARRHRPLESAARGALEDVLRRHYFSQPVHYFAGSPEAYLASVEGRDDLAAHVLGRLADDRTRVAPWLNAARPLDGARILEIGCGTGSSTVALAEQGARVTAVDINPDDITAARERCRLYGLDARFAVANATEVHQRFAGEPFDFIIFFATLEHLTIEERLLAMRRTWDMTPVGACWCVVETPNRLWWYDAHTSMLPFYHWLPDSLAMAYARLSPRPSLRSRYGDSAAPPEVALDFARRGRGVSYHEFELTLGPPAGLKVVSALAPYLRHKSPLHRLRWHASGDARYEAMLRRLGPPMHPGFYQPFLDLIVRKA